MPRSRNARPQLEPTTGFLIVRVAEEIDRRFSARLKPLRLNARQLHVLRYLDAARAISHTELADGISVDSANLVETLDQLEADGLIRREVDSDDRRRRRISPTPAGRRKLRAGLRAADQADRDILGALDPQQLDSLRETLLCAYRSERARTNEAQGKPRRSPRSRRREGLRA